LPVAAGAVKSGARRVGRLLRELDGAGQGAARRVLILHGERVARQKAASKIDVACLVGPDDLAADEGRLGVAEGVAHLGEQPVAKARHPFAHDPRCQALRRRLEAAKVTERRTVRAGAWVGRRVTSQFPDPVGHQLEVPGLVSHLQGQTHLQLQVGLVRHPERRHLGGLDLVPERRREQVGDRRGRGQRRAGQFP
jgi:hypothetical protein